MSTTAGGSEGSKAGATLGGFWPWLRLFLGISGGAVAIACALGLLVVLTTSVAQARPSQEPALAVDAGAALQRLQAGEGSGLLLMGSGGPLVAPLQSTDALLRVTGNTVRGTVTQRFRNPGNEWLAGSYLFPLPEDAAVDHLRMTVGDRVVQGEIREKQAARRAFDSARSQGRRASLVEQQRPNAFTTHVANIAPGAIVEIEIQYQQTLALRDGAWRLRLPAVVAPRYHAPRPAGAGQPRQETDRIALDPSWQPPTMHQGILLASASATGMPWNAGASQEDPGEEDLAERDPAEDDLYATDLDELDCGDEEVDEAFDEAFADGFGDGTMVDALTAGLARDVALDLGPDVLAALTFEARLGETAQADPADRSGETSPAQAGEMVQPLLPPGHAPLNPIRITVELDTGAPILQPTSSSHRLTVTSATAAGLVRYRMQTIADAAAQEVADRDFELEWRPTAAAAPMATLRYERHGDSYFGMLLVNPPSAERLPAARLDRETTFVVDTSGSMGGESIEQAREALAFGLQRLQPADRFNIIQFNSSHSSLFPAPRPASVANLERARRYVAGLRADGGTEMRGAIAQALSSPLPAGLLGQVVFITDGAVDYEEELVTLVQRKLGARRLFTVGIGSAPNGYFMRKAADIGGGTFTYIGNTSQVESRMADLFRKLAQPMSSDLAIALEGGELAEPATLPRDLYAGEPLIVAMRFRELPRSFAVGGLARFDAGVGAGADDGADAAGRQDRGASGARQWRVPVEMVAAPESGLHVLWARQRIETLSDSIRQARHTAAPQDDRRDELVRIALAHHLVSDYTSLVAVDTEPGRPAGAPLQHGAVPANLPAGWDHEALTGRQQGAALSQTSTSAALQLLAGTLLLALGFLLLLSRRGSRLLACGGPR